LFVLECAQQKENSVRVFARFAALSAFILFMTSSVCAQRPGGGGTASAGSHAIDGKITNETDHTPIQSIPIRLSTFSGELVSMAYSDVNGNFNFTALSGADYVLTIKAEGYEDVQQQARLTTISVLTVSIALHKTAGLKRELATTGDAISTRELNLPSKAQDALAKGKERLYQKHDPAGSLPYFRKVIEIAPGFYDGYYLEGVAYTEQSQLNEAETAFRAAIEKSEHHYAEPCFALASLLTDKKQFSGAEQIAHEGLQTDAEAWRGYYEMARALLGEKRFAEAETNGMEARKRKTDFPGLYLILANIHMQLHNNEAVLEDVNDFLKLEPDGPSSGQARAIKNQMEKALGRAPATQPQP
jgi:tetratricopeptide (TPR) repeat protein